MYKRPLAYFVVSAVEYGLYNDKDVTVYIPLDEIE